MKNQGPDDNSLWVLKMLSEYFDGFGKSGSLDQKSRPILEQYTKP